MHDSSGIPAVLQYLILYGTGGLIGHFCRRWAGVPNASNLKSLADPPHRSFEEAFWQARHDEIVRLAQAHEPTTVPGLLSPDVEDRAIVSMPVYLYESRPARWLFPNVRVTYGTHSRARHTSSEKKVTISPVDHGMLELTRRRLIFSSSRRQREFLLDELTHFTATTSGIALAARGDGAISYFKGISATSINFDVVPGVMDRWPLVRCTFDLTGYELKEIVRLLLFASTSAPS
jgi:hypothetical protein